MNIVINRVQESLLEILGSLVQLLPGIVLALAILLMTAYGARITRRIADRVSGQLVKSRSLQILTLQTVRIGTWVLGILLAAIVTFPGLQLEDIIALLGLGSVAIGFAFQDIFKNFLAGILLLLEEPFRLGDQIIVSDYEGTVETVNIRFTKLRTYMGEVIEIPNSIVFTSAVKVLTADDCRRTDLDIGVDYTSPLPLAQRTFLETVEQVEGVLSEPAPEVDCVGFGDSLSISRCGFGRHLRLLRCGGHSHGWRSPSKPPATRQALPSPIPSAPSTTLINKNSTRASLTPKRIWGRNTKSG